MKLKSCFLLLLVFIFCKGFSQTVITGEITDIYNQHLSGATITISQDSIGNIVAYGISDISGNFQIDVKADLEFSFIKVAHLGFKNWNSKLQNKTQHLSVRLTESSEELREVHIESKIIEKRGDTLSYSVSAFKDQKDRVIADVLRKMPGIEIRSSGQIYYQGEPIQKYYIEGLDLLEGRYNLANNNLSADDVSQVQILENHQPIKLLDSLEFSERASLNIKLKKDVTLTGSAVLGSGLSPLLWKANLTPMVFTKKQQAIFSYQGNNTGNDVSREIRDFSFEDFGRQEFNISKKDWLSIRKIAAPSFSQERWLDNNVHLGSANYLIRLKKDIDLKVNVSYLNDSQQQIGNTQTLFFTPNDTISISERVNNDFYNENIQSKFILEKNTDENYLKNTLEINGFWDSQFGNIRTQSDQILQSLNNPFSAFRNKLKLLKPLGKQLITFRSNTGYTESSQTLKVNPGQFNEILNEDEPYTRTIQILKSSTFFTENSAGFTKGLKHITIAPEIGFAIQNENLDSQLIIIDSNETDTLKGNYRNNLNFFSSNIYFKSKFVYKKNSWNIRLQTPFNYRNFNIEDSDLDKKQNLARFTFEPDLYIKKDFSAFWEASVSANLKNNFGDINNLYYGFILVNYRNLQRFNAPISENFQQNYNWRVSYRNPINSIFASSSYSFSQTKNNLLYSNRINQNGATIFEALVKENYSNSHNFNLRSSKYFSKLNTTLSLGSTFSSIEREQLLNESLADIQNQNWNFNVKLESEITDWLSTTYNADLDYLYTIIENREAEPISTQSHSLDFFFYLSEQQYLSANSEYYYNSISNINRNNYFLNLNYQYTFKKPAFDLKASWNNVLNTNEFVRVSNSTFSYIQSTYRLRPSQLLVSLKFSF
jgi:hypothetical protein